MSNPSLSGATRPRPRLRRLVALLAVAAVVVGCGGNGTDTQPGIAPGQTAPSNGGGTEPDGAVIRLRFASFLGPDAGQMRANLWWAEQVEERTNGRVEVEFFHGGALLDATETLPGIGDGRADMGYTVHFYHPDELVLSAVSELPFMAANPQVQTRAFTKLYQDNADFRAEWESFGVHVLHFNPSGVIILGSKDPVTTLDDVSGLSVRAVGYAAESLQERGANPIGMPAPEIRESLERGVIDAYSSFPFEVISDLQLQEVAPHVVDLGLGNYVVTVAAINADLWESLPDDIRQIMTDVSRELTETAVWDIYAEVEDGVCDAIRAVDGTVSVLPDDEVDQWRQDVGDRFIDQWLERAGPSGQALLDQFRAAIDEFSATTDFESGVRRCAGT